MAYLALYRKYRPTDFKGIIGQDHIVKTLVNQIETGRTGHAYLFTGTRGTGKTSTAKIFAKAVNCLSPENGSPCGKCEACKALSDPSNIDVIEIDAASNNGVNEIRDLRENVQYPPVSARYKVYIIDEVHMLTGAAFNALLKTLEEPPKHVIFILATTEAHKIPATILSRCMRFDFKLVPTEEIARLIAKIYDEAGKAYDIEAVNAIAAAGEGSIRDALSVADVALSYEEGKLTYDDVCEIIGASDDVILSDFINGVISGDAGKTLQAVNKLAELGKSMGVVIKDVTSVIRNLIVIKTCNDANNILILPEDKFKKLKGIADKTNTERLIRILEIFANAENSLRYTVHPRIVFETAAIKAARPDSDLDITALTSRIKSLEDRIKDLEKTGITVNVSESSKNTSKEPIKEENKAELKVSVGEVDAKELKGKILFFLRAEKKEMLHNVIEETKISTNGNVVTVTCVNSYDADYINIPENIKSLKDGLKEYLPAEINVVLSAKGKMNDMFEEDADRVKSIFGDDIVIIKD